MRKRTGQSNKTDRIMYSPTTKAGLSYKYAE